MSVSILCIAFGCRLRHDESHVGVNIGVDVNIDALTAAAPSCIGKRSRCGSQSLDVASPVSAMALFPEIFASGIAETDLNRSLVMG